MSLRSGLLRKREIGELVSVFPFREWIAAGILPLHRSNRGSYLYGGTTSPHVTSQIWAVAARICPTAGAGARFPAAICNVYPAGELGIAQCDHGIDERCPASWNVAGEECAQQKHDDDGADRRRVGWLNFIQNRFHHSADEVSTA